MIHKGPNDPVDLKIHIRSTDLQGSKSHIKAVSVPRILSLEVVFRLDRQSQPLYTELQGGTLYIFR
jgi:hypothetical protein